jgi:hypothetical protein
MSGLPRVTDILRRSGLVDDRWFNDHTRDVGTAFHQAAAYLDEGDLAWDSVDPSVIGRLRQYQRFLEEVKPEILSIEQEVRNESLQYCGRLDRRVRINGHEGVLDFKGPGRFAWQSVQLSLYTGCLPAASLLKRWTLHLDDENYRLVEHKDRRDWDVAKAAVTLAAWKEKQNGE